MQVDNFSALAPKVALQTSLTSKKSLSIRWYWWGGLNQEFTLLVTHTKYYVESPYNSNFDWNLLKFYNFITCRNGQMTCVISTCTNKIPASFCLLFHLLVSFFDSIFQWTLKLDKVVIIQKIKWVERWFHYSWYLLSTLVSLVSLVSTLVSLFVLSTSIRWTPRVRSAKNRREM